MISYKSIHQKTEEFIKSRLEKKGYKNVLLEHRVKNGVIFDVWNPKASTAYEVLTAKIVKSAHEQDEAIISKLFRYLLFAKRVKFYLASYNHEEIEMFHNLGMEHWHTNFDWSGNVIKTVRHPGKQAQTIARKIYRLLVSWAPIKEWTREKRRKQHPAPEEFKALTEKHSLPEHFLVGLWRDWRLNWVWKLEKILPKWKERRKKVIKAKS